MVPAGAFTALVTPFAHDGSIDYPAVARLLAWNEDQGMKGVVIAGTNGEGPSLSAVEKRDLVNFAVKHAGKLNVIAGLGTCSLPEAVWLSRRALENGVVASLVLPPFYFRSVSEDGLSEWFSSLLKACELPCILYNFPASTGITLPPSLVSRLFKYPNAAGIKDSSGDGDLLAAYLKVAGEHNRSVFVGDETLLLSSLTNSVQNHKGSGTISGLANSFPRLISRQVSEQTEILQTLINEACANLKCHPQPAVHKFVLELKGLPGGHLRPPLEPISDETQKKVREFVGRFGF